MYQSIKFRFFRNKRTESIKPYIQMRSNVIQYDEMGYPLRLVINRDNEHVWIDTYEREGDIVLKWDIN